MITRCFFCVVCMRQTHRMAPRSIGELDPVVMLRVTVSCDLSEHVHAGATARRR